MKTREAYPVLIKQDGKDFLVYVPDLNIYTEGKDLPDAIYMARDAIGLKWMDALDEKMDFPDASTKEHAIEMAKMNADEDLDFSDGVLTYVDVDCELYRNRLRNRAVKKNCTLPFWLREEAERRGINFSKVLQEALMKKINMA